MSYSQIVESPSHHESQCGASECGRCAQLSFSSHKEEIHPAQIVIQTARLCLDSDIHKLSQLRRILSRELFTIRHDLLTTMTTKAELRSMACSMFIADHFSRVHIPNVIAVTWKTGSS